jgi:hypothetical protein
MRTILDEVDPVEIRPAYKNIFRELERGKALEPLVFSRVAIYYLLMEQATFPQRKFSLILLLSLSFGI